MLSWLNFKPEQFATILKFQEKRLLSSNNVTSHIVALFTTWCLSQTGVSQPLVLWQSVGFSARHQNVLILFDFLCRLFACTVKPGDFFSLHVAFQRFLNECIKFAVTCSVRAKFWSLPSWVTSAWSPSSSTKPFIFQGNAMLSFGKHCNTPFVTKCLSKHVPLTSLPDNWSINNMQKMGKASTKHQSDELKNPKQCLNDDNQHTWVFDKKQQPTKDMFPAACHSSQHWPRKQMMKKNDCWHFRV